MGKLLRLKQQHFFVAASLRDIINIFKKNGRLLRDLPTFVAVQLNDTHPSLSIAELMRLLVDEEDLEWGEAWSIVTMTFAYTNHTVLPEALEKWPVYMMEQLLPRHVRIIFDINHLFLLQVEAQFPGDWNRKCALSIIEENPRMIRMAHLAVIGSHTVNGVAKLHSKLLKKFVFADFHAMWPDKFTNVTNGITPRRWLYQANPEMSALITRALGEKLDWITDLELLRQLLDYKDDPAFQDNWMEIKRINKERLAAVISSKCGFSVNPNALFDMQAKRFHEYKRQLMNILGVIYRWLWIKHMDPAQRGEVVPRVVIFGGKAAPGYYTAKLIIKLVNRVAAVVNIDEETSEWLKVVFLPNYNVSLAELIIPASDLSEHISTAGMEASGTSNMKFALNGGLIIGTLDGANIEIKDEIGEHNMFIFGVLADEVAEKRAHPPETLDPRLSAAIAAIREDRFGPGPIFEPLINSILGANDYYLVSQDFPLYLDAQAKADAAFKDKRRWAEMSISSTACMGRFSADRSITEYAQRIWHIEPARRPGPIPISLERLSSSASMLVARQAQAHSQLQWQVSPPTPSGEQQQAKATPPATPPAPGTQQPHVGVGRGTFNHVIEA
eukprot:TRINITY_DN5353_c0_g1_i2.p1 TRINITY_DN5353_c0_g1~~TRINITY_DN5353_c0_g1_i2.p1  ORF type:complete len:613 (-),score=137.70 TRINITY_DN5353_c0_g1_i2:2229-4067(-)